MSRGAINEQSSVRKGAGYDEVYQTGQEPKEGHSWSSERETSARSPDKDWENYIGEEDEEEIDEGEVDGEGEIEDDWVMDENDADDRTPEVGSSRNPGSGHTHPFILPQMWTVNDFLPKMTTNIFKNLRDRFQIPDHIPIRLLGKFEKCYSGETANTGMYDATLTARLRLPLTVLHRQLANFLGPSVSQIAPNAWRIFIGAEILWGRLSGGNRQLTLDEFFWCYRPQHIILSQGIYHFAAWKKVLRLIRHTGLQQELEGQILFLSKGQIGYAVQRSGIQCPTVLITLGALLRIQV